MQINGREIKEIVRVIDALHVEVMYISGRTGVVHRTDLEEQSDTRETEKEFKRLEKKP